MSYPPAVMNKEKELEKHDKIDFVIQYYQSMNKKIYEEIYMILRPHIRVAGYEKKNQSNKGYSAPEFREIEIKDLRLRSPRRKNYLAAIEEKRMKSIQNNESMPDDEKQKRIEEIVQEHDKKADDNTRKPSELISLMLDVGIFVVEKNSGLLSFRLNGINSNRLSRIIKSLNEQRRKEEWLVEK